jgi:hypothetical protein
VHECAEAKAGSRSQTNPDQKTAFRGMLVATVLILTLLSEATDTDEPVGVIPRDAHSDEAVAAVGHEACHTRF